MRELEAEARIRVAEIDEENLWLDRLKDVVDNDPDATQNWYIPLQLLEFVGFDMDEVKEQIYQLPESYKNMYINEILVAWIEGRIAFNEKRKKETMTWGKIGYVP